MAAKDATTQKWLARFRELMDWFLNVDTIHGGNLDTAHVKGLAVNYLAAKLGMLDPPPPPNPLFASEQDFPYRMNDWQPDYPQLSGYEQKRQWRIDRMAEWKARAEERAVFQTVPFSPEVTTPILQRYCDCLERIIYRAYDWDLSGEVFSLGAQANDLAARLGLTHPDWLLAFDLGILPHFVDSEEISELPLPWDCDEPPAMFRGSSRPLVESEVSRLREGLKKAEALLSGPTATSQGIPAEHWSAPLSMQRLAELWGGDMTAKKLRAMIDSGRLSVERINRQTFVFDTRQLPDYVVKEMRQ